MILTDTSFLACLSIKLVLVLVFFQLQRLFQMINLFMGVGVGPIPVVIFD